MTKRLLITAATLAWIAISAQSAPAAITKADLGQEMDHGVSPAMESGFGSELPSDPDESSPVESPGEDSVPAAPADHRELVSEGPADPGPASMAPPVPSQAEEDEENADPEVCGDYADQIDQLRAEAGVAFMMSDLLGGWSGLGAGVRQHAYELDSQAQQLEDGAAKEGCYGGGPAPE